MFNKVFIALTVVAVLAFTAAAPASMMNVNLVSNPGFETQGGTEEKHAANWNENGIEETRTNAQAHTGSWSMLIDVDENENESYYIVSVLSHYKSNRDSWL